MEPYPLTKAYTKTKLNKTLKPTHIQNLNPKHNSIMMILVGMMIVMTMNLLSQSIKMLKMVKCFTKCMWTWFLNKIMKVGMKKKIELSKRGR